MDFPLFYTKAISLLYLESKLTDASENSAELISKVLDSVKLPEATPGINLDQQVLEKLSSTLSYLCSLPANEPVDKNELLQRVKVNCGDDVNLYESMAMGLNTELDEVTLKSTISSLKRTVQSMYNENRFGDTFGKLYAEYKFKRNGIKSVPEFSKKVISSLEPFATDAGKEDPAIVGTLDLKDPSSLKVVLKEAVNNSSSVGILKTGWQCVNRALQGGFRRGEEWVLPARKHSYKTGFSLSLFKQIAIYNEPVLTVPTKKPLLLRITFEDTLSGNLEFLYKNLWFNEYGELPSIVGIELDVMIEYIMKKMQVTGYCVKMMRVKASEWTYRNIFNTIMNLEAQGYEVHLLMIDYLPLMPTTGCAEGPTGTALQDLYGRVREFCNIKGITVITPHQLSSDAILLKREGSQDFVKQVCGGSYYKGCKSLDQEVDGELYLEIEKANGRSYLTGMRGKHRGVDKIPDSDIYFVLPFPEKGPIPDDYGKREIALTKIGGRPIGSDQEDEFWVTS
jgi:hypothetical protein